MWLFSTSGPLLHGNNIADYALSAGTTAMNAQRLLRATKLNKPILLEGSPGVGKTSLVGALARASGNTLVRINLSEQTVSFIMLQLMGLFFTYQTHTPYCQIYILPWISHSHSIISQTKFFIFSCKLTSALYSVSQLLADTSSMELKTWKSLLCSVFFPSHSCKQ